MAKEKLRISLPDSLRRTGLKLLLSGGALYLVIRKVDPGAIVHSLAALRLPSLLLAILFFNASQFVSAFRLDLFFRRSGAQLSKTETLRLYYTGMFYNLFLPGGIGGDGYKVYLLHRRFAVPVTRLLHAVLLDRLSGFGALLLLAGMLIPFARLLHHMGELPLLLSLAALLAMPALYLVVRFFFSHFLSLYFPALLHSMGVQLLQLGTAFFLFQAMGERGGILDRLLLFLISSVAAVLPITVGGAGARELVFLYGYSTLGLAKENGVAFALSFFAVAAISSLPALLWIRGGHSDRDVR